MNRINHFKWLFLLFGLSLLTVVSCGESDTDPAPDPGTEQPSDKPDDSEPISPEEGMTLYGLVADTEGNPVEGVVVSDGFTCAATDAKGVYQIKRNRASKYAYLSMPSGYEVPGQQEFGAYPLFYKASKSLTGNNSTPFRVDFTLKKRATDDTNFVLVAIGDPQPDNDEHVQRFRNETIEDIKAELKQYAGKAIVGVALGDIIGIDDPNTPGARLTKIKSALGASGIPVFCVCGNHDKDKLDFTGGAFENIMGPLYYSFNIGDVHFVMFDNLRFYESTVSGYNLGFTDEEVAWLKEDLKFVPTDKRVVICYHAPLYDNFSSENAKAIFDQLQPYTEPTAMAGHTHYTRYYVNSTYGMREYILSAACGYFWRSNTSLDGIPNGYYIFEFDGTRIINSYFKGTDRDHSLQMRLYRGNATYGGPFTSYTYEYSANDIVANIFFADDNWTFKVYEDGKPTDGKLTRISNHGDYWIWGYTVGVLQQSCSTICHHLYKYTLHNPAAKQIRVEATDHYGNVYSSDQIIPDNDFSTEAPNNK